jgi:hypothetical protein
MMYAFPVLITLMMIYMFWHAGFSRRRDRIQSERAMRRRTRSGTNLSRRRR